MLRRKNSAAPPGAGVMHRMAAAVLAAAIGLTAAAAAQAADQAVIVMYHRFNEGDFPSTNIRLDQFDQHLTELASGKYTVMALPDIVDALKAGKPLPDRAVAITIDDAYATVYEHAFPRLRQAGFPFTVFVATEQVDRGLKGMMTWDQLREMQAAGATIGHHTVSHDHMPDISLEKAAKEIDDATGRFEKELGKAPRLFAYPYGEASLALETLAKDKGFDAAFGQHSGVAHASLGFFYLPRFALNESFGGIGRFRLAVNALALPVADVTPADHLVGDENPPAMGFTLMAPPPKGIERIACFTSSEGRTRLERLGETRVEVRVHQPFPQGRTRLNCTVPGPDGRWYWLGRQFYRGK